LGDLRRGVAQNGSDKRGTAQYARMSELQRERIVAAALEVLGELGDGKITIKEIVGRAGVSRKTFYEHFENREGCFGAALEEAGRNGAEVRKGRVPLTGLGGRGVTYRTLRVLSAIGELAPAQAGRVGGPSNREVAARAGVADEGNISRMLARLEGLGLVERDGVPARPQRPRGEANAWRLTERGEEVRTAVKRPGREAERGGPLG
jgi:AcrR family transcriptional regulator